MRYQFSYTLEEKRQEENDPVFRFFKVYVCAIWMIGILGWGLYLILMA